MSHQARIDAGIGFHFNTPPPSPTSLDCLSLDTTSLSFRREKSSSRGINRFKQLTHVWAYAVNQEFLEELASIPTIEWLFIRGTTATDLTPLCQLRQLRRLVIKGGTKIENLDWIVGLPALEALALENFRRVRDVDPITSLPSLRALGLEGGNWTNMRVASLAPLSSLTQLHYLFLTSFRAEDRSLRPLYSLINLKVLECAAFFPDEEFRELRKAIPRLECSWFDMLDRYGSIRAGIKAEVKGMTQRSESI
jgi:Leucine-rich repeat (LRR) protein